MTKHQTKLSHQIISHNMARNIMYMMHTPK